MYRTARFSSKSLAITPNGSVTAFFFFSLIQFIGSEKNSTFRLNYRKTDFLSHQQILPVSVVIFYPFLVGAGFYVVNPFAV